jgi:hypothetical protein
MSEVAMNVSQLNEAIRQGLVKVLPGPEGIRQVLPLAKLRKRKPNICIHDDYTSPETMTDSHRKKFVKRVCQCGHAWYVEIK